MGLLSFLSLRKPTDRSSQVKPRTLVKSQAYDTLALPSNRTTGSNYVVDNVPIGATMRSTASSPTEPRSPVDDAFEASAPAPFVPRFREISANIERPRTAPNGAGGGSYMAPRRMQRDSFLKAPPVALKTRKSKPDRILTISPPISNPTLLSPQPRLHSDSTPWRYQRTKSTLSVSSGKGFVDLLDAQSELKPQAFHTRVKAAGARDFGEDVADRNLGENGLDISSPKALEFYAWSEANARNLADAAPAPVIQRSRFSSAHEMLHGLPEEEGSEQDDRKPHHPFINGLAQNPATAEPGSGPMDEQEARLSRHLSQKDRGGRRMSLSSYIPSAPSTTTATLTQRPQSMHRSTKSISFSEKDRFEPPEKLQIHTEKSGWSNYSHLLPKGEPKPPPSPSFARDSVVLARSNYSLPTNCRTTDGPYRERPATSGSLEDYERAESRQQRGRERSKVDGSLVSSQVKSRRRQSLHDSFDASDRHTEREPRRPGTAGGYTSNSAHKLQPLRHETGPRSRTSESGLLQKAYRNSVGDASFPRTKSLGAPYDRFRLDEFYGHVPVRTSSIPPATANSTATTASSTSSSMFPRPTSRHTPNTSIDLATISSVDGQSPRSPTSNGEDGGSYWTAMEDGTKGVKRPVVSPTYEMAHASFHSAFNIDDYFSSGDEADDAPHIGPRRPRGEAETDLLFQASGYGGLQLPGLYDAPREEAAEKKRNSIHSRRHSRSILTAIGHDDGDTMRDSYAPAYSPELDEYYSSGQYARASVDYDANEQTFLYDDDEEDDAPVVYRKDLAPGRKGTTRTSALGNGPHEFPEPIAEESDERVDIRTAVRMRKEVKARKRAEGEKITRERMSEMHRQEHHGYHAVSERRSTGQVV
ncbi:hypothetical protein F5X68DRAFT_52741 [Plectosphaerella plurivora]|uniref:Uncharacterized protein n=1 Tax=Plectosphaerella plurivora TaxID=936078 RepID=A0A9P8V2L8_9PEZI|nr:hypothetical protein F5X68DRAFT_52741 [Plectosphaerella plurivora]